MCDMHVKAFPAKKTRFLPNFHDKMKFAVVKDHNDTLCTALTAKC